MNRAKGTLLSVTVILMQLSSATAFGNDLQVIHVALTGDSPGSHAVVEFDLSWDNSWRNDLAGAGNATPFNYDATWVFVKFSSDGGETWQHASLSSNSANHSVVNDNGVAAIIQAAADSRGVFIFRAQNGAGSNNWDDVRLRWDYAADGVSQITLSTIVNVLTLEMVYIPGNCFYLGDRSSSPLAGQFEAGTSGASFKVNSEASLTLGGGAANSLGNNNNAGMAHADDFNDATSKTLPTDFPKGYNAFFAMKYEITQGQYADFLNLLSASQAAKRDVSLEGQYAEFRGSISGNHPLFAAGVENRACNFLSWIDGAAYADWAGLRPMSELEFEKICRGNGQASVTGEYAWGNTDIVQATMLSGAEDGTELVATIGANSVFGDVAFAGGNGGKGAVRGGIFAAGVNALDLPTEQRRDAGASIYGVMELSGNVWERVVSVGKSQGRSFIASHGDGSLTSTSGFEGNATNSDWPGIDGVQARGVTGATGSGFRGGSWSDVATLLRTSDRACATTPDTQRKNNFGFRCVRTTP